MPAANKRRALRWIVAVLAYLFLSFSYLAFSGQLPPGDWRSASRASTGLAPDPATTPEAVVQVRDQLARLVRRA
jgi:hypothetical protein